MATPLLRGGYHVALLVGAAIVLTAALAAAALAISRAAAGDLALLTDSLWPVIDDMHELGPLRQLELLLMLARRSGKLTEF